MGSGSNIYLYKDFLGCFFVFVQLILKGGVSYAHPTLLIYANQSDLL